MRVFIWSSIKAGEIGLRKENAFMKNKFIKNGPPDFDKIQQALAAEWLERSKDEKPNDLAQSESVKDSNTAL